MLLITLKLIKAFGSFDLDYRLDADSQFYEYQDDVDEFLKQNHGSISEVTPSDFNFLADCSGSTGFNE